MSTRCNIVIKKGDDTLYLYHHFDGYPEGVGGELLDLRDMLKSDMTPQDVHYSLVYLYGDEYELTDRLHGDIEYVYFIKLNDDNAEITFSKCVRKNPMKYSEYSLETIKSYTFQYIDSVFKSNSYTKGDLLDTKVRFTCDFIIDMKNSHVYKEMPNGVPINAGKLLGMLLDSHVRDIVDNTKVEILQ